MTVEANDTVERYTISGTGPYAFSFRIFSEDDLAVKVIDGDGLPTTLTLDTHYTVPDASVNDEDGGTLSLVSATATTYAGLTLDIRSNISIEQPTGLENQGAFRLQAIEGALDRQTRQLQDFDRRLQAALRLPDHTLTDAALSPLLNWLSKYVYINASGQPEPAAGISDVTLTQSVIAGLLSPQTATESAAGVTPTDKVYLELNVKRYNAALATALSEAIDVVNAGQGGTIFVPRAAWTLGAAVNKTLSKDVRIVFEDGATVDATGFATYAGIRLSGSEGTAVALTTTANIGETAIVSTLASQLVAGDIIRIICTDQWIDAEPEFDQPKGEMCQVISISGTTINLLHPLEDTYDNATTTVAKVTAPRIAVEGLVMERDTVDAACLEIYNARDVQIIGGRLEGTKDRLLRLQRVFGGRVEGVTVIGTYDASLTTNYGLSLVSCNHIEVVGGFYHAGRHSIALGGFEPCRNVTIRKATCSQQLGAQSAAWNVDTHFNTDKVTIDDCTIYGGLGVRAPNATLTRNRIRHAGVTDEYTGLIFYDPVQRNGRATITENNLEKLRAAGSDAFGIRIGGDHPDCTIRSVIVANNSARNLETFLDVPGITESGASIQHLLITQNIALGNVDASVNIEQSPINHLEITGNHFEEKGDLTFTGKLTLRGNTLIATGSNRWDVVVTGDVKAIDNLFSGFSASGGIQIDCKYVDRLHMWGNDHSDSTGTSGISGHPRLHIATAIRSLGGIVGAANEAAATAPRYGLWATTDYVVKRDMAANGDLIWACTTAGYAIRGAWGATTAYTVGQQVTNGGKLYRCVIAGTSAGSGGPTAASGEEVDGTVTWEFISSSFTTAAFKEGAPIDA